MFKNKTILITGGTGSFGNAFLKRILKYEFREIRIFSRDEKKQDDMRKLYNNSKIKYFIGDVREKSSLEIAVNGCDYIFHAAALKQVPSCEFHPMEAVKTNIIGSDNLVSLAIQYKVKRVICLSTDKAVYPINAMGVSKAMMEKVILSKARLQSETIICITRYGNVIASRGSVIPLFINQILSNSNLTITDPNMTRFMMSLDEAVDLVVFAFMNANSGEIIVQKSPAATIEVLVKALKNIFKAYNQEVKNIGTRHGEKLFEILLSREERVNALDKGNYFVVPLDNRDLNYDSYYSVGNHDVENALEYTSHNTYRLDVDELSDMLKNVDFVKHYIKKAGINE